MDRQAFKTLSNEDFIHLVETSSLSERKLAEQLGITRSFLSGHYKDCKFQPFEDPRVCTDCAKSWTHLVKSRRDSTKRCPECKRENLRRINHAFVKGRPSHKRQSNKSDATVSKVLSALNGTSFISVEEHEVDHWVYLICECGKRVAISIKDASRKAGTRKLSCGCNSTRHTHPERNLVKFLRQLGFTEDQILVNKRYTFLDKKELDIYIPSKKVAIEFHGLAMHSERPVFREKDLRHTKMSHEFKYLKCRAQGIKLIQIFEDELQSKPEIVLSMLRARLGQIPTKLHARKLELREVPSEDAREFFDANHISGHTNSSVTFGLYSESELVSALSLRNPWVKAHGDRCLEIARFASKLDTVVVGGFGKMLGAATTHARACGRVAILTYADCRFGTGAVYLKNGFEHLAKTKPNYYYEKAGVRESRFKHRKRADLPEPTEREQQNALGWYAIYDAGSEIYRLSVSK